MIPEIIDTSVVIDIGIIVLVIIGLTELIKKSALNKFISSDYMPIVSLILGLIAGFVYVDADIQYQLFVGIAMGLSASGLFDLAKIPKKISK